MVGTQEDRNDLVADRLRDIGNRVSAPAVQAPLVVSEKILGLVVDLFAD